MLHLDAEQAQKNRLCYHCHDEDNSRDFEFGKYYGDIKHKGMDDYTDPKVHQRGHAEDSKPAATGAAK